MDKEYLESLVEQKLSTRQIAKKENKSQTSVRYWLKKYKLKTKNNSFKDGYRRPNNENEYNRPDINFIKKTKDQQHCSCCNVKLIEENSYYNKHKDLYYSLCKSCFANYTFKRRFNFKIKALNYKGNSCQKCGYNKDITALEFHHKDPSTKEITPAKLYYKSWEFAKQELDKCELLCSNCHREEHARLDQHKKMENEFSTNFTASFTNSILTGKNTGLKSCKNCDIVLTPDNKATGTHKAYCKPCDSKIVIEKTIIAKERAAEYMGNYCSICGYGKCIRAIEFHHLDPTKKSKNYHKRFTSWGFDRQKKELENCIIVCSNCHREIHSKDEHKTLDKPTNLCYNTFNRVYGVTVAFDPSKVPVPIQIRLDA